MPLDPISPQPCNFRTDFDSTCGREAEPRMRRCAEHMSAPDLFITTDRRAQADDGSMVESDVTVKYEGHIARSAIRVRFHNGDLAVLHPHCFACFRDDATTVKS
jgi:hypothetical protein